MVYTVSITSQGQINIPIKIRRALGLSKNSKAIVSIKNGAISVRPIKEFLELKGSLHHKTVKNKSIGEILRIEDEAIEQGFLHDYKESLK